LDRELSFEKAMERMEEIIALLEDGNLDLEKSLEVFEEGVRLYRLLSQKLKDAEGRVKVIMEEQESAVADTDIDPEGDQSLGF
jgi:exodeoxyribonuclease VII small subunit